jgi:hypothetical protein
MNWPQHGFALLLISVFLSSAYADDKLPACAIKACDHVTPDVAAKIHSCEVTKAINHCDSLGLKKEQIRDCKSEAFCPGYLDQSFILGCLVGTKDSIVEMIKGVVTAPATLFEHAIDQTKYESKYFNSYAVQSCKEAEDTVAKNPSRVDLDCEQNFWHAACPRTLIRNCKNQLLEDFPDMKDSYGANLSKIKYEKVLSDVRTRLQKISDAKPSLAKYLRDHSTQQLTDLINQALEKQGNKFSCMSNYAVTHYSCDKIFEAVTLIAGGYLAASKIAKASKMAEEVGAAESVSTETSTAARADAKGIFTKEQEQGSALSESEKEKYKPINPPSEVNSVRVDSHARDVIARLDNMGVKFHETEGHTYLEQNAKDNLTNVITLPTEETKYGKILQIDDLPPAGKSTSYSTNALLHPEMAEYKAKLEKMGYHLTIDTSIPFTGSGAYFSSFDNIVALRPNSTWQTFLHEFQHAEFDHYFGAHFGQLQEVVASGKNLNQVFPNDLVQTLGKDRVSKIQSLLEKGMTYTAVNETLSVDAELKAMGFHRYIPNSGAVQTEQYALKHQITELSGLAESGHPLTAAQTKALAEAKKRYDKLSTYDLKAAATIGAGTGAVAGTAIAAALDYRQILYDEHGNVVAQKKDNTWVRLQHK